MCNIPDLLCNIHMKQLQHTSETYETLKHTLKCNVTLLLGRMELVVVELDTDAELDATGGASTGGGGTGEQRGQNPSCDHEQEHTAHSGTSGAGE